MTWFLEVFGALGHAKSEEPGCLPNPPLMTCLWGGTGVLLFLLSRPECFHWLSSSCMPGTCSNAWRAVLTSSLDTDESWGPETLITYPVTPTSQLWVDETGVKAPRPVKSKLHGNPVIFPKIVKEDGASSLEKMSSGTYECMHVIIKLDVCIGVMRSTWLPMTWRLCSVHCKTLNCNNNFLPLFTAPGSSDCLFCFLLGYHYFIFYLFFAGNLLWV